MSRRDGISGYPKLDVVYDIGNHWIYRGNSFGIFRKEHVHSSRRRMPRRPDHRDGDKILIVKIDDSWSRITRSFNIQARGPYELFSPAKNALKKVARLHSHDKLYKVSRAVGLVIGELEPEPGTSRRAANIIEFVRAANVLKKLG